MGNSSQRDARRATAAETERKALELRRGGMTYGQIAHELGFHDRSGAKKLIARALKAITKEPAENVFKIEIERMDRRLRRLEEYLGQVGTLLKRTDLPADQRLKAIEVGLKTDARQHAIAEHVSDLYGLEAPKKVDANLEGEGLAAFLSQGFQDPPHGEKKPK